MADIVVTAFYTSMKYTYGLQGVQNDRFDANIVDAINRCVNQVNGWINPSTRISRITSLDGTITGFDEDYEHVLGMGVMYHLALLGHAVKSGETVDLKRLRDDWRDATDDMRQDVSNQASDADTDDDATDIAQLGALG